MAQKYQQHKSLYRSNKSATTHGDDGDAPAPPSNVHPGLKNCHRTVSRNEQPSITGGAFSYYLQKKPSTLLRDLSMFLSDSADLPPVLYETADVLRSVTKALGVTLYLVDTALGEIYISRKNDDDDGGTRKKWPVEEGTIVAAFVAYKKEYILVEDIVGDARFPEGIGYDNTGMLLIIVEKSFILIQFFRNSQNSLLKFQIFQKKVC